MTRTRNATGQSREEFSFSNGGNVVSLQTSKVSAGDWLYSPHAGEERLVEELRGLLLASLLKPRGEFEKACFLIVGDANVTKERYAAAFFHGLEIYAKRKFEFYNPGSSKLGTDEMWVARLILALKSEDYSTVRYLMSRRIDPAGQRRLSFLAQGLADAMTDDFEF